MRSGSLVGCCECKFYWALYRTWGCYVLFRVNPGFGLKDSRMQLDGAANIGITSFCKAQLYPTSIIHHQIRVRFPPSWHDGT